jgi:multimeric flavodoxin WrbA
MILGICGSPKKKGSTTLFALKKALSAAEKTGVKTRLLKLADYNFSGCIDCGECMSKLECSLKDDFSLKIFPILMDPEIKGFIYASPVYFGGVTAQIKAFIDRCVLFRRNDFLFEDKVAGVLTVGKSRNGGQELAALDLIKNCLIQGMIVVPDASPTSHFGGLLWSGKPEGIEKDEMGIQTAHNMGKKVALTIKKLHKK